jgi:hypothetical protein
LEQWQLLLLEERRDTLYRWGSIREKLSLVGSDTPQHILKVQRPDTAGTCGVHRQLRRNTGRAGGGGKL